MKSLSSISPRDLTPIGLIKMLLEINSDTDKDMLLWVKENASDIKRLVFENGALLIRGLNIRNSEILGEILTLLFEDRLLDYIYRSTPRTEVLGKVYTSSEYHPGETILLHNENSYTNRWPLNIAFCCIQKPAQGGQTPIADSREIFKSMPKEIVEIFKRKGLMYIRNYINIDLPWSEVFQTTEKDEVERYCGKNSIEFQWLSDDNLRTKQFNMAVRKHPISHEEVWFNAAHMFHISNLSKEVQQAMISVLGEENLPRNVCFGDGSPIDIEIFETIHSVYEKHKIVFDWEEGDLLLLDNMLFAHGRQPYVGERRVLVGMANDCTG